MKILLIIGVAAILSGCATVSPCFNYGNEDILHQTGVVVQFGKGYHTKRSAIRDYTCPNTLDADLLDPPFPFDDNQGIK